MLVDSVKRDSLVLHKLFRDSTSDSAQINSPSWKRMVVAVLEFAVPEVKKAVGDRKNFKTAEKTSKASIEKQLVSGNVQAKKVVQSPCNVF